MGGVVVVDDDAIVGAAMAQAIEELTCARVRVFDDPLRALEALAQERAELLITDLSMPWMDGEALLASARRVQPGLAVIVVSGYGRGARVAEALGARFLRKPFDARSLADAVERALRPPRDEHGERRQLAGVSA